MLGLTNHDEAEVPRYVTTVETHCVPDQLACFH